MPTYKRLVLAKRPDGPIESDTFRLETPEVPKASDLKADEVLVKVDHLSVDPGALSAITDGLCGIADDCSGV